MAQGKRFFAIKCAALAKNGLQMMKKNQFGVYFVALFVMKLGGAVGTWTPKCEKKKNGAHETGFFLPKFYLLCLICLQKWAPKCEKS